MKAVVLGPRIFNYSNSIAHGLRCNGFEVTEFTYLGIPRTALEGLLWGTLPQLGLNYFPDREIKRCLYRVRNACQQSDLLIVLKGDHIPLEMLRDLASEITCPLVTWFMDSLDHIREGIERARIGNYLLYFEGADATKLKEERIPALKVDLAYDPRSYYRKKGAERLYDVSFTGSLWPNRLAALEHICMGLVSLGLTARVVGGYISRKRPWEDYRRFARSYPNLHKLIRHKQHLTHHEINTLNNQSRIAMNILHPMSKDSLNMRAFESCGSGSFQLIQSNPAVSGCFEIGSEIETFDTLDEAVDKIGFYTRNDFSREKIAHAGFLRASTCHTMPLRIREIIEHLTREGVIRRKYVFPRPQVSVQTAGAWNELERRGLVS
jgi:Glycosyl transferases group 1